MMKLNEADKLLLEQAAKIASLQIEKEICEYQAEEARIVLKKNESLLQMAKKVDSMRKPSKKHLRFQRYVRLVALFLVCIITVGGISFEFSEGFKEKIFDFFYDSKEGSTTILSNDKEKLVSGWANYWFPDYIPEGYELEATEKRDNFLLFKNSIGRELRICRISNSAVFAHDIDTNKYTKEKVGLHDGYYFFDKANKSTTLIYRTDSANLLIELYGSVDKTVVEKVAKNMRLIE